MKNKKEFLEAHARWEQAMMAQHGWYIHYVISDERFPCKVNYHTHGIPVSFQHPDLQICLNISPQHAGSVFHTIIDRIKTGLRFELDRDYKGVLHNDFALRFAAAREGGRKLQRVLIPDPTGKLDQDPYHLQLTQLTDGIPLKALYYETADISTPDHVYNFFKALMVDHQLNFHPDDRFEDYIDLKNKQKTFTTAESATLNQVMDHCFAVCGKDTDIYEIALKVFKDLQQRSQRIKDEGRSRRPKL
ncbi:DUF4262 domain-containing protein [Pseudoflavitalea sp. X16]|uniref:DUF4262 domain-containing protein n=1 Tax=Paraflavitalea devenefica TaxID=2716334 RepID=UPI0014210F36|nr:DUF4262 domain-containing protein [Paraflavitalea devenefica]NII26195.1 DUF4262 domain-containing protein [Paraflavitalea devenefica]